MLSRRSSQLTVINFLPTPHFQTLFLAVIENDPVDQRWTSCTPKVSKKMVRRHWYGYNDRVSESEGIKEKVITIDRDTISHITARGGDLGSVHTVRFGWKSRPAVRL